MEAEGTPILVTSLMPCLTGGEDTNTPLDHQGLSMHASLVLSRNAVLLLLPKDMLEGVS